MSKFYRLIFMASVFSIIALASLLFGEHTISDRALLTIVAIAPSAIYTLVESARRADGK
jgi:hypothetical protein